MRQVVASGPDAELPRRKITANNLAIAVPCEIESVSKRNTECFGGHTK
jgi:hypothetical protein